MWFLNNDIHLHTNHMYIELACMYMYIVCESFCLLDCGVEREKIRAIRPRKTIQGVGVLSRAAAEQVTSVTETKLEET